MTIQEEKEKILELTLKYYRLKMHDRAIDYLHWYDLDNDKPMFQVGSFMYTKEEEGWTSEIEIDVRIKVEHDKDIVNRASPDLYRTGKIAGATIPTNSIYELFQYTIRESLKYQIKEFFDLYYNKEFMGTDIRRLGKWQPIQENRTFIHRKYTQEEIDFVNQLIEK